MTPFEHHAAKPNGFARGEKFVNSLKVLNVLHICDIGGTNLPLVKRS